MLPFKPPLRILVVFVAVSSVFLYLALFRRDLAYLAAKTLPLSNPDKLPPGTDLDDKTTFIQAFLDHEIDGPFNPVPIQKVCAAQKWNPDLTILCGAPQGGIGNVRNVFLTCIRYAMEAGGETQTPLSPPLLPFQDPSKTQAKPMLTPCRRLCDPRHHGPRQ